MTIQTLIASLDGAGFTLPAGADYRQTPEQYDATSADIKRDLTAGITNAYRLREVELVCDRMAQWQRRMFV